VTATLDEHLVVNPAGACARRFLATPLREIIVRRLNGHGAREGKGKSLIFFQGPEVSGLDKG
jgi:hypothetical protein